jgi:lipopolysaccharide export system protein LptA
MKIGFSFNLLIFFIIANVSSYSNRSDSGNRLRLVHADSLISDFVKGESVRKLMGDVKLVQDDAYMMCNEAQWWEQENKLILFDQVMIYDGKHTLYGDRVDYDGETLIEKASGHVILISGKRKINTELLTYHRKEEIASGFGDVIITDFIERVILKGDYVKYNNKLDYGLLKGHSQIVKIDTVSNDTLIVSGSIIEAWGKEQKIIVSDSVSIKKGKLHAFSKRAEYRSEVERLILQDLPVVFHQDQKMRGDTIKIDLQDVRFKEGIINGNASIVWTDSIYENTLKGRSIHIENWEDSTRQIIIEDQAESLYHVLYEKDTEQGMNSMTGDRISLFFRDNQLEWIKVESDPGMCTGVYTQIDTMSMAEMGKK